MAELIARGSISCQRCGTTRRERVCPKCGYDACLIRISVKGKRLRIYHDKNGIALSFSMAFQSLTQINKEIKDRSFNVNDWLQPAIQENKFKNKYEVWIRQKNIEAEAGRFDGAEPVTFDAVVRIDTPGEADYFRNGGILQYVLRSLLKK